MDSTSAARPAGVANNQTPSSDSLHSLLTPQSDQSELRYSHGRPWPPFPEKRVSESAFQLLRGLRAPRMYELVSVYYSRRRSERPLLISRDLLMRACPVFASMLCRDGLLHDPNTLHLDTKFSVLLIFVYWLYHHHVPEPKDFDGVHLVLRPEDRGVYQIMLVRSWAFAENWGIRELQNAIMGKLFHTFSEADEIDANVLGTCLRISSENSAMRFALIGYMLWNDDLQEQVGLREDERLLADRVDVSCVDGFEEDFALAAEVFEWEGRELDRLSQANAGSMQTHVVGLPAGRERPRAERYFVTEG